jgi:serine/threonine protein kinase
LVLLFAFAAADVTVYDIEELYRTVFIITELVEGESLRDTLRRLKRIPPAIAARFLVEVCASLAYARQKGILHMDINPSDIFVQSEDRIKILDFGVACPSGCNDRSIFEGTIYYMAPEQILCKTVDPRTDIYSLGISAYEIITGKRPLREDGLKSLMTIGKILTSPIKEAGN